VITLFLFAAHSGGTPATSVTGTVRRVTTAPAPTRAPLADGDAATITAPLPIEAPLRIGWDHLPVGFGLSAAASLARGMRSLMNMTPWPTNTSSSMSTPSQMKVCDEILQSAPIVRVLLDFDESADLVPSPTWHPYRLTRSGW
jgi:hypothetical protein